MSTRSLTIVRNHQGEEIACLYRHCDGYLEGAGVDLAYFLQGKTEVNGISNPQNVFNGPECLFVQMITHFKIGDGESVGGYYLYPPNTRDVGEEYIYLIDTKLGEEAVITVEECGETIFIGGPAELLKKAGKKQ